ncbi:MAG: polysaccharide biosynthesis protein [Firmicutes bacterium]|nr:polysaccharide biosynthesis protein [Bacillota bacterium]
MSRNNFLKGAAILGIAGICVKILGAFYRIPLGNIIGDEGMGYYQASYPLYNLMFAISTSGIPIAIAKLVSEKRALGDYKGAQKVFQVSFLGLILGGILTSLIVFFNASFIVEKIGSTNAYYSMIALTPALLFVPIMSAFRGYFQGRHTMVPTAISQVLEQLFRVVSGLSLTIILLKKGLPMAAGGASFGASVGAVIGTFTMIVIYFKKRKFIRAELDSSAYYKKEKTSNIIRKILSIAIPITIGASVVPLLNTIDVMIVIRRLQTIGLSEAEATSLYGQLSGFAQTLINFPQVFSVALAMSLVPAVSASSAKKNYSQIKSITKSGVRVTLLIGLPAALGLYTLATPIIKLLYFSNPLEVQESAGAILKILSFSVIFLTLVQSLTAILQGLGKPLIPVRNLFIGGLIKVILTYILTGIDSIGIKGAAISTIVAYLIASILNLIEVKRHTKTHFSFINIFVKPVISVSIMTIIVKYSHDYLSYYLTSKITTIISVLLGGITYGLSLLITGAVTENDFKLIPAGKKISKMLKSFGLLKG